MQNRLLVVSELFSFLNNKDKLTLREVSNGSKNHTALYQIPPYKSKSEFVIGINSLFYEDVFLKVAWGIYRQVTNSKSLKGAMLYKLNDLKLKRMCTKTLLMARIW